MPGKHRKQSPIHTEVAKRGGTGLAAAALSVTGLSTAVVTGTTAAVAPNVQLMALVSAANSTSQFFAGSSYYGTDWNDIYLIGRTSTQEVVPFFRGPQGIADVINGARIRRQTRPGSRLPGGAQARPAPRWEFSTSRATTSMTASASSSSTTTPTVPAAASGRPTQPFAPLLFTSADPTPNNLPALTGAGRRLRVQHQLGRPCRSAESVRSRKQPGRVRIRVRGGKQGAEHHAGSDRAVTSGLHGPTATGNRRHPC